MGVHTKNGHFDGEINVHALVHTNKQCYTANAGTTYKPNKHQKSISMSCFRANASESFIHILYIDTYISLAAAP